MKKTLTAILAALALIVTLLPQAGLADDSAFDLAAAKAAYESKVAALKKSDKTFSDAYVIDLCNNEKPVLAVIYDNRTGMPGDYDYKFSSGVLEETEQFDNPYLNGNAYSYRSGSNFASKQYFAVDNNEKIYVVRSSYHKGSMHNETRAAKTMVEADSIYDFEIGYYTGDTYNPLYRNSRYKYNDGDYSYTVYSYAYDESGNEYYLDCGNDARADLDIMTAGESVLAAFGLRELIERDSYMPEYKGKYLYKYLNLATVYLNDAPMSFEKLPVIKDGRVLVPLRAIFEAMGAAVAWDGNAQKATSSKNGTTVEVTIGSNVLYKNGAAVTLDVPAQLIDGYTMVPVRAVAEAFGADVAWNGDEKAVYINYADNSEENDSYEAKVNAFLSDPRFKDGADWGVSQTPLLTDYDAKSCAAYAADFCKFVFDKRSYRDGTLFAQPSEIRAGDVIHVENETHWFVVISRDGNSLTVAEGNWGGEVVVSDDLYTVEDNILKRKGAPFRTFSEAFHMQ